MVKSDLEKDELAISTLCCNKYGDMEARRFYSCTHFLKSFLKKEKMAMFVYTKYHLKKLLTETKCEIYGFAC